MYDAEVIVKVDENEDLKQRFRVARERLELARQDYANAQDSYIESATYMLKAMEINLNNIIKEMRAKGLK
jgi:hypothetical protein